jgi:mRNA interferase RelE/StbE
LAWKVEIADVAESQLMRLDTPVRNCILNYLHDRIEGCKNPRHFGEPLKANKAGLWRYRVGDFRVICEIQDDRLLVLAIAIGHRREIYKG